MLKLNNNVYLDSSFDGRQQGTLSAAGTNRMREQKFYYRHIPRKVLYVKFNFDIRFSRLMHSGNIEMDKLGSFVREETYTILT